MTTLRSIASFALLAMASCASAPTPTAVQLDAATKLTDFRGAEYAVGPDLANGKHVALVFWQTWCESCREESPALAAAARELSGKVAFYGIVSGGEDVVNGDEVLQLAQDFTLPYPQIRDPAGELANKFRVRATPTILVYDASGREVHRGSHPPQWAELVR